MPRFIAVLLLAALSNAQIVTTTIVGSPQRPPVPDAPRFKPEELCALEGSVKDENTGQPLAKVSLVLTKIGGGGVGGPGMGRAYSSSTDSGGKFVMKDVEPGQYRLSAARSGFVRTEYGSTGVMRPGTTLKLEKAQALKGIELKLIPHAVITGRVVDADGEPMLDVQIQALRPMYRQGKRELFPAGHAGTNDLGEYRMHSLAPGRYLISATARGRHMMPDGVIDASGKQGDDSLALTYHPGVLDAEQGSWINVPKGSRIQGIDVTLAKVKAYTVRGRVNGSIGRARVMAVLVPKASGSAAFFLDRPFVLVQPDGAFEIRGVRPGSYEMISELQDQDARMTGRAEVEVRDGDVSNVVVTLQPAFEVKGTVRVEGGAPAKLEETRVWLERKTSHDFFFGGGDTGVKPDGSFSLRFVKPGKYAFRLRGLPEGHYLKSARMGSADAMSEDFEIASAGDVELVISPDAAKLSGSVTNAKGDPAQGATVLLLPVTKGRLSHQSVTTDQTGNFNFASVAPGDYNLVAVEGFEYGSEQNPEFLKIHQKFVEKIALREKASETKQIKSAIAADE